VTNDGKSFATADLNTIYYATSTPPEGKFDIHGLTLQGRFATKYFLGVGYGYRNFDLSTNYTARDLGSADMITNQVHELGHSFAQLTGEAPVGGGEDPFGVKLQDCFNEKMASQK